MRDTTSMGGSAYPLLSVGGRASATSGRWDQRCPIQSDFGNLRSIVAVLIKEVDPNTIVHRTTGQV